MNCDNVDKLISAYVDRELPADLEPKIRYHLAYCKRCFKTYSEIQKTKELLSSLKSQELPDAFWKETWAKLKPNSQGQAATLKRRSYTLWTALAAAACLLLAVSAVSIAPDLPSESDYFATSAVEEVSGPSSKAASLFEADRRFGYSRWPRAVQGTVQITSFGSGSSPFSIFDWSEILPANDPGLQKEKSGTSEAKSGVPTADEEGKQTVKTHYRSPGIVPAGWSGGK